MGNSSDDERSTESGNATMELEINGRIKFSLMCKKLKGLDRLIVWE